MEDYFKFLAVAVLAGAVGISVMNYNDSQKAQKAMELGLQECTELDSYHHTIIVYKKECK